MAMIHFSYKGTDYQISEHIKIGEYHYGYWKSYAGATVARPFSWVQDTALVTRKYREWFCEKHDQQHAGMMTDEMVEYDRQADENDYREFLDVRETYDDFLAGTGQR